MKILIATGLAFVAFIIVTMWACLRVASREDRRLERLSENSNLEKYDDS